MARTIIYQSNRGIGDQAVKEMDKKPRRERIDKGEIWFPDYHYVVLRWIGEMGGVQTNLLRLLLGRDRDDPSIKDGRLSPENMRRTVRRWKSKGWIRSGRLSEKDPQHWVWLTTPGMKEAGLPFKGSAPRNDQTAHLKGLTHIRFFLEEFYKDRLTNIVGPKQLDSEYYKLLPDDRVATRNPDLKFRIDSRLVALEYERKGKTHKLTQDWMHKLYLQCKNPDNDLSAVWIVYVDSTENLLKQWAQGYQSYFTLIHISKFPINL